MTSADSRGARVFLASFLVLFLEVALIRWMPAYIRLLAYFSNFILLASFLGIGVGCLMAPSRRRLFTWFPLLQAVVIGAAYFFRLEVAVQHDGQHLFHERYGRAGRRRRKHDAAAADFRDRRGPFRDAGAAHGPGDGRAAAASRLHDQPAWQPGRRRPLCRHFVAAAVADVVVRDRLRCGGAAPAVGRVGRRADSLARAAWPWASTSRCSC